MSYLSLYGQDLLLQVLARLLVLLLLLLQSVLLLLQLPDATAEVQLLTGLLLEQLLERGRKSGLVRNTTAC